MSLLLQHKQITGNSYKTDLTHNFLKIVFSYLDLGLPLYIGGIPLPFAILPNTSQGISACIRNLFINQVLLDLDNFVAQENSQSGCSQVCTYTTIIMIFNYVL